VIDVANLSRGLGFVLLNASFSSYGGSGRLGAGVAIVNDLDADGLEMHAQSDAEVCGGPVHAAL
jgi:hypothetical protein